MGLKTKFKYQGHTYELEYSPKTEEDELIYTIVLGTEPDIRMTEICPDGEPGMPIMWKEHLEPVGPKALDPHFIQAIGEAIEANDE